LSLPKRTDTLRGLFKPVNQNEGSVLCPR